MKIVTTILPVFVAMLALASLQKTIPLAKLTVKVADVTGIPVQEATVRMTFHNPTWDPKEWGTGRGSKIVTASTNTLGQCVLSDNCDGELGGGVAKENFYRGWWIPYHFDTVADNKWQPWNPTVQVVLKKIINPIPMYARHAHVDLPVLDQPAGFDLAEGDWVSPNGRGKTADLVFKLTKRVESFKSFGAELLITFSNPGDGIQFMPTEKGSDLRSPYSAPNSAFTPSLSLQQGNSKERGRYGLRDTAHDFFFRVRTVMGTDRQVVSALFGKIYGAIEYFPVSHKTAKLRFTYYLNPTPNDRNIEFDPKRNLFTNLNNDERVTQP
ncbi:MAG TPA: hypothetical protein VLK33_03330 [Terriglobales bacterium]|nr:hypothetical protein [Terriglobales bacterium]